ncbi:E3 ubiquitin-protein ligase synoviolin A [Lingula anatina]|uniref:RING-type E3 ubiquitin transferase n=1 Tax=Lingula anatina TaxID=7574 RepID=A0A1S3IQX0_LINAN|nr:E3 ubiquitin-protein ligase synoviolin A [Lingula anatina]|eukprot:XP_013400615.1 E3 ubiquitin-protein ligase synoviolin A [Lingula anatina]
MKMRAVLLTAASFMLTGIVIGNAYLQKKQFYPSVVYITKSSPSMAVLYIQAFVFVILMGKLMRKIFFGQLRPAEMEHLIERSWYAVTETCLAFTVFRDDFSPRFVALFTLLLFLKCFHWLGEDRVDYMERSPIISWLFHIRCLALLLVLSSIDLYFVNHAYYSTLIKGASVQLVFGFEYAILFTLVLTVFIKYILHTVDVQSENPWENKAVYLLYSDLGMGFVRVVLYITFMIIMIKVHTFPLFAIRPMYLTIRAFKKALNDVIMSRRAIRNMNTLYPDATEEDIQSGDNVCIICREEMAVNCKKLPCNHIFHTSCLRSWFQRQQTCPTCRMDVLRLPASRQRSTPPQQPQQPQQQPNLQQPHLAGLFGGAFPGAFPGWPPAPGQVPPQPPPAGAPSSSAPPSTATPSPPGTTAPNMAGAGFPAGQVPLQPGAPAPPLPGFMPPFMPPPPPMFVPGMMPFGMPVPSPPPNFSGLNEEELRAMEGTERRHLEARIQHLRSIHTLLDAAVVMLQQYTTMVNNLGATAPPSTAASSASTTVTQSPSVSSSSNLVTSTSPSTDFSLPRPLKDSERQSKIQEKDSSKDEDDSALGATGFSPVKKEELIPKWEDPSLEEESDEMHEIRRRRLQKFSSQTDTDKSKTKIDDYDNLD